MQEKTGKMARFCACPRARGVLQYAKKGQKARLFARLLGGDTMEEGLRVRILDALRTVRCGAACSEGELHAQIADAFARAGLPAQHEARLAPRCRIDFLIGNIGVEIKKSRPVPGKLRAQLARYAACEGIEELIVVAPRAVDMPRTIGGKRVTALGLERLWGISLP